MNRGLHSRRSTTIAGQAKLLMALRFFSTGSFQITIGDFCGIHRSTVCKNLKIIAENIAALHTRYINMPRNRDEYLDSAHTFYGIAKFPNVLGTIDCTHVRMQNPGMFLIGSQVKKIFEDASKLPNWE